MNQTELKSLIKSQNIAGAYIFCGEEDYLKKHYLGEFVNICCPDEAFATFNHAIFNGEGVDLEDIGEAIKAPPFLGELKLIEWRYPDLEHMHEGTRRSLEELAESLLDYPYAVFVIMTDSEGFIPGSTKKPSKLAQRLSKNFNVLAFDKCTDAQLAGWIKRHFEAEGVSISPDAPSALIFRSGHSMEVLNGEILKLSAYAKANGLGAVGKKEVDLVASPTLECDAFALSTAITDKDRDGAFRAIADMKGRRLEPTAVLAMMAKSFGELATVSALLDEGLYAKDIEELLRWNPYKIKFAVASAKKWGTARLAEATSRLRALDAGSKSGGASGFRMIEIFICEFI